MEYYWNNGNNTTTTVRGYNGNFSTNPAWDSSWDLAAPTAAAARPDWNIHPPPPTAAAAFPAAMAAQHQAKTRSTAAIASSPPLYYNPDPHMTSLKLGKRHYFGDLTPPPLVASGVGPFFATKRGKAAACVDAVGSEGTSLTAAAAVQRCQVAGCAAALVNAKDYHRRHKVCEMHAKAPKVVLLGIEQRFCQQCSRFHAMAEFDESKRSCRRRLAGHNERRRKTSQEHHSLAKKHYQEIKMMGGPVSRNPQPHSLHKSECAALSLLSPTNFSPCGALPDLPARCSAALRELIAENRASVFACRQLIDSTQIGSSWAAAAPENRDHVTLNLMQGPGSCFGLLSGHGRRSSDDDGDGDCSQADLWKLPLGY